MAKKIVKPAPKTPPRKPNKRQKRAAFQASMFFTRQRRLGRLA